MISFLSHTKNDNNNIKRFLIILTASLLLFSNTANSFAMMSIEQEKALGRRLLMMVKQQVQLVNDPESVLYVSELGHKILHQVGSSFFTYHFFIINDDGLNAFAMPGGYVFVHSGLIEAVDDEDELLCVLAHEISHVECRHIARRIEKMQKVNLATLALAIAGLFLGNPQATSAVFATSSALNLSIALKYSRQDEEDADRQAYQWICKAGYDPRGLAKILKKMVRYRWLGTSSIPSYLLTHPAVADRITYIDQLYQEHPCTQRVKEDNFELHRVQIRLKCLTQDPVEVAQIFRQTLKKNPTNIWARYGLALSLSEQQDFKNAIKNLNILIKQTSHLIFYRDLAEIYINEGRYKRAISILNGYLKKSPNDIIAQYDIGLSYLRTQNSTKALPYLMGLLHNWPLTSQLYFNIGLALAQLHQMGAAHYYFYRHFLAVGQFKAAMYHKKFALKLLPKNSIYYQALKNSYSPPIITSNKKDFFG